MSRAEYDAARKRTVELFETLVLPHLERTSKGEGTQEVWTRLTGEAPEVLAMIVAGARQAFGDNADLELMVLGAAIADAYAKKQATRDEAFCPRCQKWHPQDPKHHGYPDVHKCEATTEAKAASDAI